MKLTLLRTALRDPASKSAAALLGMQATRYVFLLAIIPCVSRRLGGDDFGMFMMFQSLAYTLWLILEYGFDLSATREVARWRGYRTQLTRIVAGVLGAKVLLLVATAVLTVAVAPFVPVLRDHPGYLLWSWLWGAALALQPTWFFQGVERLGLAAMIDVACRLAATVGVFLWVAAPGDGCRISVLFAGANLASAGLNLLRVYRRVPFRWPSPGGAFRALRMGWHIFIFRGATATYTRANAFVLGLLLPSAPALVGVYGVADKVARALQGLLAAPGQAFYPRISALAAHDRPAAARMARLNLLLMVVPSVLVAAALALAAGPVMRLLVRSGGPEGAGLLQLLAVLIPLISLSNVLGIQWMLPLGMEKAFNVVIVLAGALNLALAVALVPRLGPFGMAWASVIAETFVAAGVWFILRRGGLDPLTNAGRIP